MSCRSITPVLVVPSIILLLASSAGATTPAVVRPVLPSIGTPPPPSIVRRAPVAPDLVVEDKGFFATLGRKLAAIRIATPAKQGDDLAWRNEQIRDAARDRDATSLGLVNHPKMSGLGAGLAGLGVGATALPVLGKFGANQPITVEPALVLGGGGLVFKMAW